MEYLNIQSGGKRRSSKKRATKKQLAALARGRAIRAKNIRNNRSSKKKSSKKKSGKKKSGKKSNQRGGERRSPRSLSKSRGNWGKLRAATSANSFINYTKKQVQRKLNEVVTKNKLNISQDELNKLVNINLDKTAYGAGIEKYAAYIAELIKNNSPRTPMNNIQKIYDKIVIETTKKLGSKKQDVLDLSLILHKVTEKVVKDSITQTGGDLADFSQLDSEGVGVFERHPYIGAAILLGSAAATGSLGMAVGYQLSGPIMGAIGGLVSAAKLMGGVNTRNIYYDVKEGFFPREDYGDVYDNFTDDERIIAEDNEIGRKNVDFYGISRDARGPDRMRLLRQKSEQFDINRTPNYGY